MVRTRTTQDELFDAAFDSAIAALESLDMLVVDRRHAGRPELQVLVDDREMVTPIVAVSYCTGQYARQLVAAHIPVVGVFPLLVSDRITVEARAILSSAMWSWLDRRGWMHLRGPGIRVDTEVLSQLSSPESGTESPIAGRGGIAVAYWLCAHPDRSLSPNRSAAELGVAPSTISTAVRRMIDSGVVADDGAGLFPELFWELAGVWKAERRWLASVPNPAVERNSDPGAPTWRRSGSAAAIAYGAPIVTAGGEAVELYVPGPVNISIALRRYGATEPGRGPAAVTVAPTRAVTAGSGDDVDVAGSRGPEIDGWLAAPVLAVALDLAQDRARGREILADWNHPDAVWR